MLNDQDKTQEQLDSWCSAPGINFTSKETEENYKKRIKRIADVIRLKKPDRVPIVPMWEYFYATYSGNSCHDVLYDRKIASLAAKKTILELEPDAYQAPIFFCVGPILDALGSKDLRWPGHGIGNSHGHQYVEAEHMKADEYDDFINDPSDFMLRKYLPRVCGNLKAFESFSPFRNFYTYSTVYPNLFPFGTAEVVEAICKLVEAGEASVSYIQFLESFRKEMASLGFPAWAGSAALAPFDAIATTLRGTHGIALDMYRQPEAVKAACEKFVEILIENAVAGAKMSGIPIVFMPLNKGTAPTRDGKGGLLSPKQFDEFYWPTLKKVISGLIEYGLVPNLLIEGDFTSRLETIKDVPKGTCIYHFETVDIQKAKKVLGNHVCFRGSVPIRLLVLGTPQEVRDSCKELIDVLGEGGGFIMDAAMASEDVKPENIKAMIDFTRQYGVYNK